MARRRSKGRRRQGKGSAPKETDRSQLVPWRASMTTALDRLRTWSRDHYGAALDAYLAERFGDVEAVENAEDLRQAADDCACAPGSAGDGASILSVFCEQGGLERADAEQARRWERERHRGVFVVQRARRDRLFLWDPLEGAPLTLHLLDKLPASRLQLFGRGAVVTAAYQPWLARLVAVAVEFFGDPAALQLFREQAAAAGTQWHEPPAPAPQRKRGPAAKA